MLLNALLCIILLSGLQKVQADVLSCDTKNELLFQCADGTCIERKLDYCNGTAECPDGSDEYIYNASKEAELGIRCQYPRKDNTIDQHCHLPHRYKCDHEQDCADGIDECNCRHTFNCNDGDCIIKVTYCDGVQNCKDNTDEVKFNRTASNGFQCPVTRTHVKNNCVLPDQYLCDGDSDCDEGIDECFCEFTPGQTKGRYLNDTYANDKCFRCLDRSLIIPNKQVCDGVVHCQDLSDECLCTEKKNYTIPSVCESVCDGSDCDCKGNIRCLPSGNSSDSTKMVCVPPHAVCDNHVDCLNGEDENFCPGSDQYFQCYDNITKILKTSVCNGPKDCPDGSDEDHCAEITDYYCTYYRGFFSQVTDWNNETETSSKVSIPSGQTLEADYPFYTTKCDGIPLCAQADDECYAPGCPEPRPGYCKFVPGPEDAFKCENSGSIIIGREVCDGKPTCNDTAPALSDDELYCPNRFYCENKGATRLPIHLPMSSRCNGIQECDDQSDEMDCSETTHYYCNDLGLTKFIRRAEVCDGTKDCLGGSDECQNCNPSPFSSDQKLISSRVLIVFLWIIGIFAVCGNFAVICHQLKNLIMPEGTPNTVATVNRILVLNLSLSDILVGIYLVALGIKDAYVTTYCQLDQEWRSSTTCSALGSIALIGTETSVFILLIMTAYRLYLVIRPFKKQKNIVVKIAVAVAWACSFLLAFLPHASSLNDYFVSCVWYSNQEFIGLICHNELEVHTKRLAERSAPTGLFRSLSSGDYTWKNMFEAVQDLNSSYVPERFFGYYSAHSVCLPRFFPDTSQDKSWGYSMFLVLLNFFAFVFILVSYIIIYRATTKRTAVHKAKAEDRAATLQKKVTRIVATDFCCWMPICIMAFIKVSGIYVSDLAYAVTAIILIPINAAMNPFLYSDIVDIIWEKMLPIRNWCNATPCGRAIERHREESTPQTSELSAATGTSRVMHSKGRTSNTHSSSDNNVSELKADTHM